MFADSERLQNIVSHSSFMDRPVGRVVRALVYVAGGLGFDSDAGQIQVAGKK